MSPSSCLTGSLSRQAGAGSIGVAVEAVSVARPRAACRCVPHVQQGHDPASTNRPPSLQVLPKLSSSIVHEIDSILGNKPYSKKDYRS